MNQPIIPKRETINGITIVTLTNGKRVANFSSPHEFKFVDGSVLPAVSNEDAEKYKVDFIETELGNGDVELFFSLSKSVIIERMEMFLDLYLNKLIDIVYIPLPMLTAMKDQSSILYSEIQAYIGIRNSPFRCIRIEDRINKLVSIDKQCI